MPNVGFKGEIVIGEGEQEAVDMLHLGEIVGGDNSPEFEIALDALEGAIACASGAPNSASSAAASVTRTTSRARFLSMTPPFLLLEGEGCSPNKSPHNCPCFGNNEPGRFCAALIISHRLVLPFLGIL